ncbi:Flp pilus assembly protein CpaB [Mesorhizobium sp. VNQ89]|uniref:Flp pilus assembly protein CpaB n=1 Tax=Mesorhizobium quangtriensis TaxID=3157709 RepID=UPI0032B84076
MIGIAAVFGAISIFAADLWVKSTENARIDPIEVSVPMPDVPRVEFGKIVVASAPLRFGMQLDRAQLNEIPWPQGNLPEGAFGSIDELFADGSRVVLSPIEPSEPVLLAKLSGANGRATLSNLLAPGMRAVTIRTDEIAGVGGFITPGDRVDIVLTRDAGAIDEVSGNASGAAGSTIATEIVVENAKVLTVGQGADERQTSPQVVGSVTVEVSVDGAKKIALARNVGSLSLSLRSAADVGETGDGLTTISSFGGSVSGGAVDAVSSIFGAATAEPEGPKFKTVIVTRGLQPQSYQVVTPERYVPPETIKGAQDFN